jgi:ADP-ribose pyrophosphatase
MSAKQIEIQSASTEFQGFFRIELLQFKHSLYQGGMTESLSRELFRRGNAVVVLLYDMNAEKVVLVEQCRVGALHAAQEANAPEKAWLMEPVAGMIDSGETVIAAAEREVLEETGSTITSLEYVCQFYPSPGACDEMLHLYAAEVDSSTCQSFAGVEHDHEDIRVVALPFDEAKTMLLHGQFNVASTYIALHWLFFQKFAG